MSHVGHFLYHYPDTPSPFSSHCKWFEDWIFKGVAMTWFKHTPPGQQSQKYSSGWLCIDISECSFSNDIDDTDPKMGIIIYYMLSLTHMQVEIESIPYLYPLHLNRIYFFPVSSRHIMYAFRLERFRVTQAIWYLFFKFIFSTTTATTWIKYANEDAFSAFYYLFLIYFYYVYINRYFGDTSGLGQQPIFSVIWSPT